jgi:hypothetical protein
VSADGEQPLDECVFRFGELVLVDLAALPQRFELEQPRADGGLVVELGLRLLLETLGEPDSPPHRGERERQETGDQAHAALPVASSWSAKL